MDILFFSYVVRNLFQKMQLVLKLIDEELNLHWITVKQMIKHTITIYIHIVLYDQLKYTFSVMGGEGIWMWQFKGDSKRLQGQGFDHWILINVCACSICVVIIIIPPSHISVYYLSVLLFPHLPSLCVTFLTLPHSFTSLWCLY